MALRNVLPLSKVSSMYAVNRPNESEGLWQPVYDFQSYATAGTTNTFLFFQVPVGQGGKTLNDTNMESAGTFPSPKHFLCVDLQVVVFPGVLPGRGAGASATAGQMWNDIYTLGKTGTLNLFVGSKSYLTDSPLMKFPPHFRLDGGAAIAGGTAATIDQIDYASAAGKPYEISPVFIPATQNFNVSLFFAATTATPSGANARIGVILGGFLYRLSQ